MTEDQFYLLQDKVRVWRHAADTGSMELRDYNRRCAEALTAALVERSTSPRQIAWMLEMPANPNSPARWWNPDTGWMIDPGLGLWFARKRDADAYKATSRMGGDIVSSEHVFGLSVGGSSPRPDDGKTPGLAPNPSDPEEGGV